MSSLEQDWLGEERSERQQGALLAEVYRNAMDRFCREVTQDNRKVALVARTAHIQDIETLVIQARRNFEQSRNHKLRKWLDRVTRSIMYYGNIFDVLAQHHPEYVALAWGAMKFLFVAVMNHENAITGLSKGLALIGEALPRVELATTLYPTERMLNVVEKLYVCILQFFVRSHDWYCEGTFRHILHSITRPAELRYQDLLDNIAMLSRTTDQLAISGSQLELRGVKTTLQAVLNRLEHSETWMQEVKATIINYQAINSSSLLDTNQKVSDLQFAKLIDIVSKSPLPDPVESLNYGIVMRKRRQMQHKLNIPKTFWRSSTLQKFSDSQSSSLIVIKSSFRSRYSLRDAAVVVTEELQRKSVPVLWAVQTGTQNTTNKQNTSQDILRSLVAQALRLSSSIVSEKASSITCTRLRTTFDQRDWFQVLGSAIERFQQQVYIMLDLELLLQPALDEQPDSQIFELFFNLFQELSNRGLGASLKVMVFTYRPALARLPSDGSFSSTTLPTVSSRQKPIQRSKYPYTNRRTAHGRFSRDRVS